MADSAASTTSLSTGPATTKRRARAASSNANKRSARAAIPFEQGEPAQPVRDAGHASREKDDGHRADLFADDDAQERVQDAPQVPSFDPRQGTLAGFEVPAEVFASVNGEMDALTSEGERGEHSQPSVDPSVLTVAEAVPARADESALQRTQPGSQQSATSIETVTEASTPADAAPQRVAPSRSSNTVTSRRQATVQASELAPRADSTADALSATEFAEAIAAVHRALADERREAAKRAARANRRLSSAIVALILLVVLGVVQTVALLRFAHDSAVDRQHTEARLDKQEATLAVVAEAASSAAAAARGPANAASAAAPAAQPTHLESELRAAHARSSHAHKSKGKAKVAATN